MAVFQNQQAILVDALGCVARWVAHSHILLGLANMPSSSMDQSHSKLLSKIVNIANGIATVVNIPPRNAGHTSTVADYRAQGMRTGTWIVPEHDSFLEGVVMYPHGPWDRIAAHVGTRTTKQTRIHAQKYVQKIERHLRGLLRGTSFPMAVTASGSARCSPGTSSVAPEAETASTEMNHGWDTELEELLARYSDSDLTNLTPDDVEAAANGVVRGSSSEWAGEALEIEPLPISGNSHGCISYFELADAALWGLDA